VAAVQGMIIGLIVAVMLSIVWRWWHSQGEAFKASLIAPPADRPNATHWNARTVCLKMAGSAGIAVTITGAAVLFTIPPRGKAPSGWTPAQLAGWLLFAAITGALIGYCLALSDLVLERRLKGLRVHPVLRRISLRASWRRSCGALRYSLQGSVGSSCTTRS